MTEYTPRTLKDKLIWWPILFIISLIVILIYTKNDDSFEWWIAIITAFLSSTLFNFLPEILLFMMSTIYIIITSPVLLVIKFIKKFKK